MPQNVEDVNVEDTVQTLKISHIEGINAVEPPFSILNNKNVGGRTTGKILRPSSVALKSKNQEINRLQLAVKLPWAIFFESVDILS
ncbi:hypothetical protein TNCV_702961 [Trichonephila clavipes]|nr:hypothetical protein TNCV_702961 [Trichonephila clavipes]